MMSQMIRVTNFDHNVTIKATVTINFNFIILPLPLNYVDINYNIQLITYNSIT